MLLHDSIYTIKIHIKAYFKKVFLAVRYVYNRISMSISSCSLGCCVSGECRGCKYALLILVILVHWLV
jgi:hypothetical protein